MATTNTKIKKILISQPAPADIEKSPYYSLITKYKLDLTFYKFFNIVGVSASEFRKSRIHLQDYSAIVFNSKNAIDHFFRLAKELRLSINAETKYFCTTESIANYLQTYVQYRKRKVFCGQQFFAELIDIMARHRDETYLFPCSDEKQTEYIKQLDKGKFNYTRAVMYKSEPNDLKQFNLSDYDMLVMFSPIGVRALLQNFPNITSDDIAIAALGPATHAALAAAGLKLTIAAPTKTSPSMVMAIENYLLGKEQGSVIAPKPMSSKTKTAATHTPKSTSSSSTATKKSKSPISDKAKFKQIQEERKAQAAARRAKRNAAKNTKPDTES